MKRQGHVLKGRTAGEAKSRGGKTVRINRSVSKDAKKAEPLVSGVLVLSAEEFAAIQKCSATPQQPTEAMVQAANLHRQFGAKTR